MATITPQGVVTRNLGEWKEHFEGQFREAFGDDLSLAPETVEGQLIGVMALAFVEQDEAIADTANAAGISTGQARHLDDTASLLSLVRDGATRSRVDLSLTGVSGTNVPAGSRVRNDSQAVFSTSESVRIGSNGQAIVRALATETGPVEAPVGTLTTIVTQVAGWETVTNNEAATPGRNAESDLAFRSRYRASTARLANGPQDAIEAALFEAGATAYRIEENDGSAGGVITGRANSSQPLSTLDNVSDGSFRVGNRDFEDIDLSTATSFAEVAEIVQTALRTVWPDTAVANIGNARQFSVSIPNAADLSGLFSTAASGEGTDISGMMGWDSSRNPTLTAGIRRIQGFDLPAHTILCIVRGGLDADIASAVRRSKGLGVQTWGGATGDRRTVVQVDGQDTVFRRPLEIPLAITMTIDVENGFPSDGIATIKENLVAYAAGTWRGGSGLFDTRGFRIGHPINNVRLQVPVNAVFGHEITSISVTVSSDGSALPELPSLDTLYTLASENVSVTAI